MLFFIIYYLLSPILFILLLLKSLFNKKIKLTLREQKKSLQKIIPQLETNKKKIIIHAASAGEYEQIKPLLRTIDKNIYFTILTCMSPTIYKTIQNDKLSDVQCYHPFDLPWEAKKFLKTIKPEIYLTTRHDIWPIHLYTSKVMNIKNIIINTNLYKKSIRLKWYGINFTKYIFNLFNLIVVPTVGIKNIFKKKLKINNTHLINDSRFEQVLYRKKNALEIPVLNSLIKTRNRNIIFSSISLSDFELIENFLNSIKKQKIPPIDNIIIVPHEIDLKLIQKIEKLMNKTIKFSDINKLDNKGNIIIVDKVGILPELYKYAKITYVGGGFENGVHSTIEPLVYNNLIFYGPNIDLLEEAKEMCTRKCGFIINNTQELINLIMLYINGTKQKNKPNNEEHLEKKIKNYFNEKKDSSKKIYELINTCI